MVNYLRWRWYYFLQEFLYQNVCTESNQNHNFDFSFFQIPTNHGESKATGVWTILFLFIREIKNIVS